MADLTDVLKDAVDTIAPDIEDGTVLRITVYLDHEGVERGYTYASVYTAGRWWLTGDSGLMSKHYTSTNDLLAALARQKRFTMELAVDFDVVR